MIVWFIMVPGSAQGSERAPWLRARWYVTLHTRGPHHVSAGAAEDSVASA